MKQEVHEKGAPVRHEPSFVVLRLRPVIELSPDQLLTISSLNSDLRLEMSAKGELVVMTPAGGWSSKRNFELAGQVWAWVRQNGTGTAFDSSGGFVLPNGAIRSPDISWVENSRLEGLSLEEREKYLPLCPDFVIELISSSNSLRASQEKMAEYLENGARLGWLIDPQQRRVHVYRPKEPVQELDDPERVPADPVLPGFVLELREVWGSPASEVVRRYRRSPVSSTTESRPGTSTPSRRRRKRSSATPRSSSSSPAWLGEYTSSSISGFRRILCGGEEPGGSRETAIHRRGVPQDGRGRYIPRG